MMSNYKIYFIIIVFILCFYSCNNDNYDNNNDNFEIEIDLNHKHKKPHKIIQKTVIVNNYNKSLKSSKKR